ncbi:MAG TPA: DUF1015 domain-containing protein [Candidatus Acidoferrales bacterium]|nr:DUF1015 domain-containing protein [Candidatus Acidoferrales bacterium]
MAKIFPFSAWRYDPRRVRLADVLTQPYDKITPAMRQRYLSASPWNFIRVERPDSQPGDSPAENAYTRAAAALDEWTREGVLIRDSQPSIYPYSQTYAPPGASRKKTRLGFICLGQLEDYSTGVVFRHERTLPGPRADRLELLRRTFAQTGLLFLLYQDPERAIDRLVEQAARHEPLAEVTDEFGVIHRLWALADPAAIDSLARLLEPKRLLIADGHHRYETALAYRDECRRAAFPAAQPSSPCPGAPYERAMMALFNTDAEGLTILPTHRVVSGLEEFIFPGFRRRLEPQFDWYAYPFVDTAERETALAEFRRDLERQGRARHAIGAYAGDGAFYLFLLKSEAELDHRLRDLLPAERRLDVVLLYRLVLEQGLGITPEQVAGEKRVGYEREIEAAVAAVDSGRGQLALLVNPPRIEQVAEVAFAGRVLPEKSTDFYPKLLSGLTLYRLKP